MKYCINCRHYQPAGVNYEPRERIAYSTCAKAELTEMNPVSGETIKTPSYCVVERKHTCGNSCGLDAKWFEPKEAAP